MNSVALTTTLHGRKTPPEVSAHTLGAVKLPVGGYRLKVNVAEGELLIVNTRVWYHRTDIPPQPAAQPLSISYVRFST
jgi:hypothetical protein